MNALTQSFKVVVHHDAEFEGQRFHREFLIGTPTVTPDILEEVKRILTQDLRQHHPEWFKSE